MLILQIILKIIFNKSRGTCSPWVFNVGDMDVYGVENTHDVYKSENCMKKFCESLRELAVRLINFEKKKIISLTNEQKQ